MKRTIDDIHGKPVEIEIEDAAFAPLDPACVHNHRVVINAEAYYCYDCKMVVTEFDLTHNTV
jgi:hypothetical protein